VVDLFNTSTLRGQQRISSSALQGPPGLPGSVTTYGTLVPDSFNGNDGDVYLQTNATGTVIKAYQKNAGLWFIIGDINPTWKTFAPTVTSGTGTITSFVSITMRYRVISKVCFVQLSVWINAAGTGAGSLRVQLPVEPLAGASGLAACASVFTQAGGGVGGAGFVEPTSVSGLGYPDVRLLKYDGTTLIGASLQTLASVTYETT